MKLGEKQRLFTRMVADLIIFMYDSGYEATFGDAYRDPRVEYGHPNSLHRKRLAIDINLFKDGVYLSGTDDHRMFGLYWESAGGTWGGRFKDGNHYSLEHEGVR